MLYPYTYMHTHVCRYVQYKPLVRHFLDGLQLFVKFSRGTAQRILQVTDHGLVVTLHNTTSNHIKSSHTAEEGRMTCYIFPNMYKWISTCISICMLHVFGI